MNLFSDLLASTQASTATATGPRIQKRRGVEIKSAREIKIMREASRIVATVLREVMAMVEPGQTTGDLDAFAADPSRSQTLRERAEALAYEIRAANQ